MGERGKNTILMIFSLLFGLLLCEGVFRIYSGISILSVSNFRDTQVVRVFMNDATLYDPVLGWTVKPFYANHTIDYGIRKNRPEDTRLRTGGILVVGSSFAAGSEVDDEQTWPAQLERLIGQPVLNAAVGAYSVDQVVLRAEQLLPIGQPKVLIVEAMDLSIQWNGYSSRSRPTPYHTIENGTLVAHNSPVPQVGPKPDRFDGLKNLLAHSLVIDTIMTRLAPEFWYSSTSNLITRTQTEDVDVTCRLLEQLKTIADRSQVRMLLLAHVAALEVVGHDAPPPNLQFVQECARTIALQVVETFPILKAQESTNPDAFRANFVVTNGVFGHNSEHGNLQIARLLAAGLAEAPPPQEDHTRREVVAFTPGDGRNLIPNPEALDEIMPKGQSGKLERTAEGRDGWQQFRLTATGIRGEHYVASIPLQLSPGPYTLSFDVHPTGTMAMRAQLIDASGTGLVCDIDFLQKTTSTIRVGKTRHLSAGIKAIGSGWYRVWLGGELPGGPTSVYLQLRNGDGETNFLAWSEALTFRAVQLERGQSASEYHAAMAH